jgi:hypothetical protein
VTGALPVSDTFKVAVASVLAASVVVMSVVVYGQLHSVQCEGTGCW